MTKSYYRIMLGRGSCYAEMCHEGEFIGAGYNVEQDLTPDLSDNWRAFNKMFIPVWLEMHPDKSKVAAGLACGALWTISKGICRGDIVLCPDGNRNYWVGEVVGDYYYVPGEPLSHRRKIQWYSGSIAYDDVSEALSNSAGSIGTVSNITKYAEELDRLISGDTPLSPIISTDETIEDPSVFALEKHLEDFLVKNWAQTFLGKEYDVYEVDGELVGQQYPTDTGPLDILAISKDGKELLVVELKKGRASDVVVGQTQRYMGYVLEELAEEGQTVRGVIIALEDDLRLRRALQVAPNIDFYRYEVSFNLIKG